MRVGFASTDGLIINEHFGHAKYWEIFDIDEDIVQVETRVVKAGCNCHDPGLFDEMLSVLSDCKALFVLKIGQGAAEYLSRKGIRIFEASGEIEEIGKILIEKNIFSDIGGG